jgi:hypothetical protein
MPPRKPSKWRPSSPQKPTIPSILKTEVTKQAQDFVDTVLKPRYVQEPPEDPQFNYLTEVFIRWYHSYLYFAATYCVPGPNALVPSFEAKFARMEFAGGMLFHLAFMRHNGEWVPLYTDQTLEECLNAIRDAPFFLMG